jgi:hypothetical protein
MSSYMASANHRTPRVQGHGDMAAGWCNTVKMWLAVRYGVAVHRSGGRSGLAGKGAARRRSSGGEQDGAAKLGKSRSSHRQGWPTEF